MAGGAGQVCRAGHVAGGKPQRELPAAGCRAGYRGREWFPRFPEQLERAGAPVGAAGNDEGDMRFYYSGWAQAVLLDRLSPGWKARALQPGVYLEDLLAEAVRDPFWAKLTLYTV